MAGGGKVRVTDPDNTSEMARVVDGRLLVSGTGGGVGSDVNIDAVGGNPVGATVPVSGSVSVSAVATPVVVDQGTSPWVVSGTVAVSSLPEPVEVEQAVHANLNAQVRVQDGDGSALMDIFATAESFGSPFIAYGPTLQMLYPSDLPAPNQGEWQHLTCDLEGRLRVGIDNTVFVQVTNSINIASVIPGVADNELGKQENETFNLGSTGVMALGVMAAAGTVLGDDGDYEPFIVDRSTGGLVTHIIACDTLLNIGSVLPGSSTNALGKIEDAAHSSGSTGVMTLAVRNDTLAALAGTNGDYIPFTTDNLGRLDVMKRGGKRTYRAATTTYLQTGGATNAMFFVIAGSSTQTITIQRIRATGVTTVNGEYGEIVCEKWSTAPTGGTATTLTQVPLDSNNAAATASLCQVYTAPPTEGTLVGTIGVRRDMFQPITINIASPLMCDMLWDFRNEGENTGVVLRGTSQCISLACGSNPSSAFLVSVEVEWTEE